MNNALKTRAMLAKVFAMRMILAMAILHLIDGIMTYIEISNGCYELNPIMRCAMGLLGTVPAMIILKGISIISITFLVLVASADVVDRCVNLIVIVNLIYVAVIVFIHIPLIFIV